MGTMCFFSMLFTGKVWCTTASFGHIYDSRTHSEQWERRAASDLSPMPRHIEWDTISSDTNITAIYFNSGYETTTFCHCVWRILNAYVERNAVSRAHGFTWILGSTNTVSLHIAFLPLHGFCIKSLWQSETMWPYLRTASDANGHLR